MSRRNGHLRLLLLATVGCSGSHGWKDPEAVVVGVGAVGAPRVAFGPGGAVVLAYTAEGAPGSYDLWTTRAAGGGWTEPERLEAAEATVLEVALGSDSAGQVVVLWDQGMEVKSRVLGQDGVWAPETLVATPATLPAFAMGSVGIGWAAYVKLDVTGVVEARRFDGAGWDAPVTVAAHLAPRLGVAAGRGDDALVHWRGGGGVQNDQAWIARLSEAGASEPEQIDTRGGVVETSAAVAADGLAWVAARTDDGRIEARSCDPFTGCAAVFEVGRGAAAVDVAVAPDAQHFAVTWIDAEDGLARVRTWSPEDDWAETLILPGRRFMVATAFLGGDLLIAADPPGTDGRAALVVSTLGWGDVATFDEELAPAVRMGALDLAVRGPRAAVAWAAYVGDQPEPGEIHVAQRY